MGNDLEISKNVPTCHNFILFCKNLFLSKQLNVIYFYILIIFVISMHLQIRKKYPKTFKILSSLKCLLILQHLHSMAPDPFLAAFSRKLSLICTSFHLIPPYDFCYVTTACFSFLI